MTSRMFLASVLVALGAAAPVANAQRPEPRPMPMMRDSVHVEVHQMHDMHRMGGPGAPGMAEMKGGVAGMLLGQTATLGLSDQQVVRLAALARAAESQQTAMHAAMDSVRRSMMASHDAGGAMPQMSPALEARMKAAHDQMHANLRDALAVLTPDQLAKAWELRGPMGGMRMHGAVPDMDGDVRVERREIIQKP